MLFEKFVEYLSRLERISSRLEITRELVDLINELEKEETAGAMYLLLGRLGPEYESSEMGMAAKMIVRAVAQLRGESVEQVEQMYKKAGDVGALVARTDGVKGKLELSEVFDGLVKISEDNGAGSQERKIDALVKMLGNMTGEERKFLLRIVAGKLRLGFQSKTIFDACSVIDKGDKSVRKMIDSVYQIYPDVGKVVKEFKQDGVDGLRRIKATVGVPLVSALCQRLNEYREIIEKMGEVGVERKYDGTRVQIHFQKGKGVKTYTRNLEENSWMFPELMEIDSLVNAEKLVLDCEAVGVDPETGKILPFQVTITRKRKHGVEEAAKSVPLRFFVFDVLVLDDKSLLGLPYFERRKILNEVINKNKVLVVDETIKTDSALEVQRLHDKFLAEGYEGAVIKKWDGDYLPGRQGWNWVKIKEAEGEKGKLKDTLDLVVMGYYFGRGKRSDFGMGAFLVGLKKNDSWVSVAKIGTGLSDEQFKELKKRLDKLACVDKPKGYLVDEGLYPDVWVDPDLVVEIAADELTKSPSHLGGWALRFPRLVKFRDDKNAKDATTWKELLEIGGKKAVE